MKKLLPIAPSEDSVTQANCGSSWDCDEWYIDGDGDCVCIGE